MWEEGLGEGEGPRGRACACDPMEGDITVGDAASRELLPWPDLAGLALCSGAAGCREMCKVSPPAPN